VRLRHGFVVKCTGYDKATDTVSCTYFEDSKSGTAGADKYKVKGNIHWVSAKHAFPSQVCVYDRLFNSPHPEGVEHLNPNSKKVLNAWLEPALKDSDTAQAVQFERHGYFAVDRFIASQFNRTVSLRDSWAVSKPA
jgi:glutaminyl-tRNA synthetase